MRITQLALLLFAFLMALPSQAQVSVGFLPVPKGQYFGATGAPLSGGKVCTYAAGTNTPLASYTDSTGSVPNANPVILDSGGFASIWLQTGKSYKISVYTAGTDNTCNTGLLQWTLDGVNGVPPLGGKVSIATLQVQNIDGVRFADQFAGTDMCAKINNAITDIVSNSGGIGKIIVPSGGNCGSTISIPASTSITISGTSTWNPILTWTGAAGGTMLDSHLTGGLELKNLDFNCAGLGGVGLLLGVTSTHVFLDHLSGVVVNNCTNTTGGALGIGIDLGLTNSGLSDASFHNIRVSGNLIGMRTTGQDNDFFNMEFATNGIGVRITGNSNGVFYGGLFTGNSDYDIQITDSSSTSTFDGTWFEGSTNGILNTPSPSTMHGPLGFFNCLLSTGARGSAYLLDTTNLTGSILLLNNYVDTNGNTTSNKINIVNTLTDNLIRGNQVTSADAIAWTIGTGANGIEQLPLVIRPPARSTLEFDNGTTFRSIIGSDEMGVHGVGTGLGDFFIQSNTSNMWLIGSGGTAAPTLKSTSNLTITPSAGLFLSPANGGITLTPSGANTVSTTNLQLTGGTTPASGFVALGTTTVGSLPAAAAGNAGQIIKVSDSTTITTEGQTCAGSGTVTALAFSTGAAWKCF
ncbi:MAG: hypothetical protein ACYDA9_12820 [Terriglobia bacterium]